jgi:hypothetical protein
MTAVPGTKGCLLRLDSLAGEGAVQYIVRWPPRTPNWEILVEVPAQPAPQFLRHSPRRSGPSRALLLLMEDSGERGCSCRAQKRQAYVKCIQELFPNTLTTEHQFRDAVRFLSCAKTVLPGDRVRMLPSSRALEKPEARRDVAKQAVALACVCKHPPP